MRLPRSRVDRESDTGSDEQRVRDALTDGVRALIAASGGVRIEDEYRYFIATA